MIRYIIYVILVTIILTSCKSYRSQVKSLSPHCQLLLQELSYRIIKNDTGGYTFRFEYPVTDTIPQSETLRDLEFQNFYKNILESDSLCNCGFTYDLITKKIGKENIKYDTYLKGKIHLFTKTYYLDFGFNCGGNKCPESSDNFCNEVSFFYDSSGQLSYYAGMHYTFDIEPLYCTSKIRAYLDSLERKK